jgi:hypothetical protein
MQGPARCWIRAISLTILVLTGTDLLNPQCCAQEIAAASSFHEVPLAADAAGSSSQPVPLPPDDCFCCARNLEVGPGFIPIGLQRSSVPLPSPSTRLTVRVRPIDHPPQLA